MKGETMVSDQEIAKGVETLLRQANPNAVSSVNGVVQQLGAKLGLDLSHKAAFIRDQINLLRQYPPQLPPQPPPPQPPASKDHFTLHNHPQFHHPHAHYPHPHPQQQHQHQHQHQHQQFPPHFALHFPGLISGPYASPQQQQQLHLPAPPAQFQAQPPPPQPPQPQIIAHPQQLPAKNVPAHSPSEKTSKESAQTGAKRKGGAGGLNKVCGLSPELQAVVGESALPRTEVVRQLWAYIRKNNLQDPSNKRKIICDEALRAVFETDCTDMFKMNKLLSKHIMPLNPSGESTPAKRTKVDVDASETVESKPSLVIISEALAMFLGTTRREMLQSDAINGVHEYIKANQLEDPNSMMVLCDGKLRELFGCESIPVLGLNEMLAHHFLCKSS
ncbi:hypothetical protein Ancab_004798 [Ancistrocladus abbreviatus]